MGRHSRSLLLRSRISRHGPLHAEIRVRRHEIGYSLLLRATSQLRGGNRRSKGYLDSRPRKAKRRYGCNLYFRPVEGRKAHGCVKMRRRSQRGFDSYLSVTSKHITALRQSAQGGFFTYCKRLTSPIISFRVGQAVFCEKQKKIVIIENFQQICKNYQEI